MTEMQCVEIAPGKRLPRRSRALESAASLSAHDIASELTPLIISGKAEFMLGEADTASKGQASREELLERPWLRKGELLESVSGLVVTQHSGDGRANQYFVRGYNFDHGTDFGVFVDGMPVNNRAHEPRTLRASFTWFW